MGRISFISRDRHVDGINFHSNYNNFLLPSLKTNFILTDYYTISILIESREQLERYRINRYLKFEILFHLQKRDPISNVLYANYRHPEMEFNRVFKKRKTRETKLNFEEKLREKRKGARCSTRGGRDHDRGKRLSAVVAARYGPARIAICMEI